MIGDNIDMGGVIVGNEKLPTKPTVGVSTYQSDLLRMIHREIEFRDFGNAWKLITCDDKTAKEWAELYDSAGRIIANCLKVMPVGNITTHTADNLAGRISDLVSELAKNSLALEQAEQTIKYLNMELNYIRNTGMQLVTTLTLSDTTKLQKEQLRKFIELLLPTTQSL